MSCHIQHYFSSSRPLCIDACGKHISFQNFWQDVAAQQYLISRLPQPVWALWEQDSYEFLVLLMAALQAGKEVLLPPHRVSDLEHELAEQQIYFLKRIMAEPAAAEERDSAVLALQSSDVFFAQAQVYFYTSGSTGQPKKIPRTLQQLFNEVYGLDASFALPEQTVALATVSHQHIYGLLFKLLWPLCSGRSFYQPQIAFPEDVAAAQNSLASLKLPNYVISSPALLKRWTADVLLQDCITVYSSGGKLDAGIRPFLNCSVTEVFGSSETGGIAHRQQDDALWTPFANVDIRSEAGEELAVKANHAYSADWILTGDKVLLIEPNNRKSLFRLLGRLDRIVKLEEKRISLDAVEQKIMALDTIEQCHVLVYEKERRQILAAVAVLSDEARQRLQQMGKAAFTAQLKKQLSDKLESIAIPRQWRFLTQMPQNAQSKLNKQYLKSLFQPLRIPVVLAHQMSDTHIDYQLEFIPELVCFKGHFPNFPIYPGVGQIGFIQHFAKQNWADLLWCSGFEQVKFQDLIQPFACVSLSLRRKADKISFELKQADKMLASGRLCFRLSPAGVH